MNNTQINQPLKVLRIITRLNVGGPAQQAIMLNTRLPIERYECVLITGALDKSEVTFDKSHVGEFGRVIVIESLRRPIHLYFDLIAFFQILKVVWKEKPDLIHTHMAKAGSLGRLAGLLYQMLHRRKKIILIHTFHGHVLHSYFSKTATSIFITIERWLARHTTQLIAVSRAIKNELIKLGIGREEQFMVVPVGLKLSRLLKVEQEENVSDIFRVGIVGRLVPVKNHRLFLDAVDHFMRLVRNKRLQCEIIGDGELRQDLEQVVLKRGLSDVVNFRGWRFDLPQLYAELDCVCLTSLNEGTPLSVIEAMAAGRSVISTDVGGVRDLFGPVLPEQPNPAFRVMERGILIDSKDSNALKEALYFLSENTVLRRQLALSGRDFVQSRFTAERLLNDIEALYERLSNLKPRISLGNEGAVSSKIEESRGWYSA